MSSDAKASKALLEARRARLAERRVYVHFHLPKTGSKAALALGDKVLGAKDNQNPHSMVFVCSDAKATVDDLCDAFVADYDAAHPANTLPWDTHVACTGISASGAVVGGRELVNTKFPHASDVFVTLSDKPTKEDGGARKRVRPSPPAPAPTATAAVPAPTAAAATATATAAAAPKPAATATKPTPASSSSSSSSTAAAAAATSGAAGIGLSSKDADLIVKKLTLARDFQSRGQLRRARDLYKQLLETTATLAGATGLPAAVVTQLNQVKQIANQQLGVIYLHNKMYEPAAKCLLAASTLSAAAPAELRGDEKEGMILEALLGQCWMGLDKYSKALKCFVKALKTGLVGGKPAHKEWAKDVVDIQVWQARAQFKVSDGGSAKREAIAVLEGILKTQDNHAAALAAYAGFAIDIGQTRQAIPYLLKALVASTTTSVSPDVVDFVKASLATAVSESGGTAALIGELHSAAGSASALSFLAQTVKDCGAVDASIELYERAYASPEVQTADTTKLANMCLNLAHTHEIAYRYSDALSVLQQYLTRFAGRMIGGGTTTGSSQRAELKLQSIVDCIRGIVPATFQTDASLRLGTADKASVAAYTAMPKIFDAGHIQVAIPTADEAKKPAAKARNPYSDEELNILAVCFTLVKVLYIAGALQPIPAIVTLLEPLRVDTDLHLTTIRNEHAYYSCITQVMGLVPFPQPTSADGKTFPPLFVVGDSHCMSSAWQTVTLNGTKHTLTPRLVTGLKCWHLRRDCRFYTKRNFEYALRTVPQGSAAVFLFGEIDCREGLLMAVEKAKYDNIDQGIALAVGVYVTALEELAKGPKKLRVFVHPIVPVLDVTRPVVLRFNAELKRAVQCSNHIAYLDFFDALLSAPTPASNAAAAATASIAADDAKRGTAAATVSVPSFNLAYALDGTHMSPSYVPLMEAALQKLPVATGSTASAAAK